MRKGSMYPVLELSCRSHVPAQEWFERVGKTGLLVRRGAGAYVHALRVGMWPHIWTPRSTPKNS
eukprot:6460827-Amphidinium_carterae.1